MAQQPFFRTAADAAFAQDRELNRISTRINRQEIALRDDLQRNSYEDFKVKNPGTLIQDVNEYEKFRSDYISKPNRDIDLLDFQTAYGLQDSVNRGLNLTGIAPAWLGRTNDETRELDFRTAKFNPDALDGAGGIDVQVRVADKKNNRSFTAPLTFLGRAVSSLFGLGGEEAVEEASIRSLPISTLNDMYKTIKEDTQVFLGDPGIRDMRKDKQDFFTGGTKSNLTYFSTNPADREKRDSFLAELAGFEADFSGQTSPAEGAETGTTTQTSTSPVSVLSPEATDYAKTNALGFTSSLPRRKDLPEDLQNYIYTGGGTPFGIDEEEYNSDQYSRAQRKRYKNVAENITNQNIREGIGGTLDPFFGPIDDIKASVGKRSVADLELRDEMKKLYGKRGILSPDVLSDAFKVDPQKFIEFQNDPVAFANKYKNNINALKGAPVSNNEKSDIIKNSPFKLSKDDLAALKEAREEGNLQEYSNIVDRIIQSGDIPNDEQQNKIVSVLQKTNSFIRTSKQLDTSFNTQIMLNMMASLPPDQREKYKEALFNFTETGYFTLAGVEQERKILSDQMTDRRARDKDSGLSSIGNEFIDLVDEFADPDYKFNPNDAERIAARSTTLTDNIQDYNAFLSASGVFFKRVLENRAKPTLIQTLLSFGQARGPGPRGFSVRPNIVALDENGDYTTDFEKAAKFRVVSAGGADFAGSEVTKNELLPLVGEEGISLLMGVSRQNVARNAQLLELLKE